MKIPKEIAHFLCVWFNIMATVGAFVLITYTIDYMFGTTWAAGIALGTILSAVVAGLWVVADQ